MKSNLFISLIICVLLFSFVGCSSTKEQVSPIEETNKPNETKVETPQPGHDNAEYIRSIASVSTEEEISIDTFTKDKTDILNLIDLIEDAMKTGNYQKWLSYVETSSIKYWQNPKNLKEIESRLPVKGLKISSIQDYFKYVFVPARTNNTVDEIRYISSSLVKAVQFKGENDIIYYTFEKVNDKWMLKLDTLS